MVNFEARKLFSTTDGKFFPDYFYVLNEKGTKTSTD